jgi:hypothetical protein
MSSTDFKGKSLKLFSIYETENEDNKLTLRKNTNSLSIPKKFIITDKLSALHSTSGSKIFGNTLFNTKANTNYSGFNELMQGLHKSCNFKPDETVKASNKIKLASILNESKSLLSEGISVNNKINSIKSDKKSKFIYTLGSIKHQKDINYNKKWKIEDPVKIYPKDDNTLYPNKKFNLKIDKNSQGSIFKKEQKRHFSVLNINITNLSLNMDKKHTKFIPPYEKPEKNKIIIKNGDFVFKNLSQLKHAEFVPNFSKMKKFIDKRQLNRLHEDNNESRDSDFEDYENMMRENIDAYLEYNAKSGSTRENDFDYVISSYKGLSLKDDIKKIQTNLKLRDIRQPSLPAFIRNSFKFKKKYF